MWPRPVQVPLAAAAVVRDHHVPPAPRRRRRPAKRPAVEDDAAAHAGAEREHDHVPRPLARADLPLRDRAAFASLSTPHGTTKRSVIRLRSGTSVNGMFTAEIALPVRWSTVAGTPSPIAAISPFSKSSRPRAPSTTASSVSVGVGRSVRASIVPSRVDDSGRDLGAADVDADDAVEDTGGWLR